MKKKKRDHLKVGVGTIKVGNLAKRLITKTLNKNRLTYGPLTIQFENEFAKAHKRKYGLFTVSGTAALQVALHAMKSLHKWSDGDEVIVPAMTFVATANVVLQNNLRPIFVDVDEKTYNIDDVKIEKKITRRTRAIIPVHLFGQAARMDRIIRIAKKHNLKVLADSCETQLVEYKGKSVGQWGDIVCFSTYTAHLLVTGVGGLALTDNPKYATKMRSLMNHGRDTIYYNIDQDDDISSKKSLFTLADRRFSFIDIGYSYRLTELEAALGIEGVRDLPRAILKRQENAAFLTKKLRRFRQWLQLPIIDENAEHAFMMYPIVVKRNAPFSRDELVTHLEWNGIETRYMMPLLNQPIYKELFGNIERRYPVARWINKCGFYIGCHQFLSRKELSHITNVFNAFFEERIT
jgi:dTDP-4-amino-4,6-dideoxygalactose transaminase